MGNKPSMLYGSSIIGRGEQPIPYISEATALQMEQNGQTRELNQHIDALRDHANHLQNISTISVKNNNSRIMKKPYSDATAGYGAFPPTVGSSLGYDPLMQSGFGNEYSSMAMQPQYYGGKKLNKNKKNKKTSPSNKTKKVAKKSSSSSATKKK